MMLVPTQDASLVGIFFWSSFTQGDLNLDLMKCECLKPLSAEEYFPLPRPLKVSSNKRQKRRDLVSAKCHPMPGSHLCPGLSRSVRPDSRRNRCPLPNKRGS